MNDYSEFRQCYQKWASWIGCEKDEIYKNTIWHQFTEMMNNEFMFQALLLAGKKMAIQSHFHSFLAANRPLYRYLLDGYLSFQYLAIRRLIDMNPLKDPQNKKGVSSISRLLSNMKENTLFITREAFVCVDGLPYDYGALLEQERTEQIEKMMQQQEKAVWSEEIGIGGKSAHRHIMFDRLSGVTRYQDRKPKDMVSQIYWQTCDDLLNDPVFKQIKNFVDKYLAHAADEPSQSTLEANDKLISMDRIHKAQQRLISLVQQLTLDFYDRRYAMVPIFGEGALLYNFSQPFVSESIAGEVYQEIQEMMKKQFLQ